MIKMEKEIKIKRREQTKLRVQKHRRLQRNISKWQSLTNEETSDFVKEPGK